MRIIRPMRFYNNAAYIELSQGRTAIIDAADAHIVADYGWHARVCRGAVYAITNGYGAGRGSLQMHRLILAAPGAALVDHIDGDGLNNRRCNLRLASKAENARNTAVRRNNKLGVKGVHWCKRDNRFIAQIQHDGKVHRLGSFTELKDADAAYQSAALKLHGAFKWGAENGVKFNDPTEAEAA